MDSRKYCPDDVGGWKAAQKKQRGALNGLRAQNSNENNSVARDWQQSQQSVEGKDNEVGDVT